ncbi:MAG TPA: HAD hydrolase family protein [Pyrinomonadaceae bacterium]|nr:HAD hydrolase family protein [Pyrinomonadaceae bacterium]
MVVGGPLLLLASRVKLFVMDCDGVLTDGRLYFSANGEAMKVFNVRDGQGIVNWHRAGFSSGIISGRKSDAILKARADELEIKYIRAGSKNKTADFAEIIADAGVAAEEAAYIGDDIPDIPLMNIVGFPVAVADAVPEVIEAAAYVTKAKGGEGAVREVIDLLLSAKAES